MADHAVNAGGDERVSGLDGHQAAKAAAGARRPARGAQCRPLQIAQRPASERCLQVERPEFLAVGIGGQPGGEQPEESKGTKNPPVAPVFALAGADIAAGEERRGCQHGQDDHQGDERRVREKGIHPTPPENGQPEVDERARDGENGEFGRGWHDVYLTSTSNIVAALFRVKVTTSRARRAAPESFTALRFTFYHEGHEEHENLERLRPRLLPLSGRSPSCMLFTVSHPEPMDVLDSRVILSFRVLPKSPRICDRVTFSGYDSNRVFSPIASFKIPCFPCCLFRAVSHVPRDPFMHR